MKPKYNTESIINKFRERHGDKYDYSKVEFVTVEKKVIVTCPIHGDFSITPSNHSAGKGCRLCGVESARKSKTKSISNLIERANIIHNGKYDYSKLENKKVIELNTIICPIHGEFKQSLNNHINNKQGCPKCGIENKALLQTSDADTFIERAKKIHNDKYDYSKVEYLNSQKRVEIICKIHGPFYQTPNNHLSGQGCKKCGIESSIEKQIKGVDNFIKESKKKHGDKYDYSLVVYKNYNTSVKLICPIHGEFKITPASHIKGSGCIKCGHISTATKKTKTVDDFILDSNIIHGYTYDYSNVKYLGSFNDVEIKCEKHGQFRKSPSNHLKGQGCPKCSSIETSIEKFLKNILIESNVKFIQHDRTALSGLELDFYIPDMGIAFELDGVYFHNEKYISNNYHKNKTKLCEEKGIRLIHIFEDEIKLKPKIVKSKIINVIGQANNKIHARKCQIKNVTYKESVLFLNENHIQGNCMSKYRYGLYHDGELVFIMTLGSPRRNLGFKNVDKSKFELLRMCGKLNTNIIGGASRLLKHFISEESPASIISYCDIRWSYGGIYEKLGFEFIKETSPNYFYVVNGLKRENRFNYRKDVLVKEGFDPSKSEHEIMLERGIYRIYDCGSKLFKLNL